MKPELDAQLCSTYPEIFVDRHAPKTETLLCWGFACGDGWYPLIDGLCAMLVRPMRRAKEQYQQVLNRVTVVTSAPETFATHERAYYTPKLVERLRRELDDEIANIPLALQVKEKWGGLCFYTKHATPAQQSLIEFAEYMSRKICEVCGTMNTVKLYTNGWHKTLCTTCALRDGRASSVAEPDENNLWGV